MTVGKNSLIAPRVAVGSGEGTSVSGKGVEVSSMGIVVEDSGARAVKYVGVEVGVGEEGISCVVDKGLIAGVQLDKMINATGRRTRKRFMVCRLGGASEWKWT
jgi:hypothetical protein